MGIPRRPTLPAPVATNDGTPRTCRLEPAESPGPPSARGQPLDAKPATRGVAAGTGHAALWGLDAQVDQHRFRQRNVCRHWHHNRTPPGHRERLVLLHPGSRSSGEGTANGDPDPARRDIQVRLLDRQADGRSGVVRTSLLRSRCQALAGGGQARLRTARRRGSGTSGSRAASRSAGNRRSIGPGRRGGVLGAGDRRRQRLEAGGGTGPLLQREPGRSGRARRSGDARWTHRRGCGRGPTGPRGS